MINDWNQCKDVYDLGQMLVDHGLFNAKQWRQFHCLCCRNVWEFLFDEAKTAVVEAEHILAEELPAEELVAVHQRMIDASNAAWERVNSLKEPTDRSDAVWPLSDEVDTAWCAYLSVECAKTVTHPELDAFMIPESASSLVAWATARKDVATRGLSQLSRVSVETRWKEIRDDEERKQASILRKLVSIPVRAKNDATEGER